MSDKRMAELRKLSDTGQTVAGSNDDIRGRDVKDRDGNIIGKVDDLLIDPEENKVRFLVVASGGFLGIGETKSFIPVDAISRITTDEVRLDQQRDYVAGAPAYDPELVEERDFYQDVYSYYGYAPYWTPGYVYSAYLSHPARGIGVWPGRACPPPRPFQTGQEIRPRQGRPAGNGKGSDCDGKEKQSKRTDSRSCPDGRPAHRLRRRNSG